VSNLAAGSHSLTVVYSGDSVFAASTSAALAQTVKQTATTTTLTGPASASVGQTITLTATVAPVAPGAGVPRGTVKIMDGGIVVGPGTLYKGVLTFSISTLKKGTHTLTAVYGGDDNFLGSTSTSLVVSIV